MNYFALQHEEMRRASGEFLSCNSAQSWKNLFSEIRFPPAGGGWEKTP
ncbi:hypothetical protein [Roseibium sp.]